MIEGYPFGEIEGYFRTQVGEQAVRPDGLIVELNATGDSLFPRLGGLGTSFGHGEVAALGDGNWKRGAAHIARKLYEYDGQKLTEPFVELSHELDELLGRE